MSKVTAIYSNSWEAARILDRHINNDGSFSLAVGTLADQFERASGLFQRGSLLKGSAAAGFALVAEDAFKTVDDAVSRSSPLVQIGAGIGMGLCKLMGTMPFALADMANKVAKEIPYGPKKTVAKVAELVVSGIINGGIGIIKNVGGWFNGSLEGQTLFFASAEVIETTADVAMVVSGGFKLFNGMNRIANSFSFALEEVSVAEWGTVMVPVVAVDFGTLVSGIVDSGTGFAMASFAGGRKGISVETLANVLWKHKGNRRRAAKELGISNVSVSRRITGARKGTRTEKLVPFKKMKGKGGIARVPAERLAEALEKYKGSRTLAAKEVGMSVPEVSRRITRSRVGRDEALIPFKEMKARSPRPPLKVSTKRLAEALERHKGSRTLAAKEVGMTTSGVSRRISRAHAGKDKVLIPFKEMKGVSRNTPTVSAERLAEALEKYKGSRALTAKDVGLTPAAVSSRIYHEPSLAKWRNIRGYGRLKVSTETLAKALKKHNGNRTLAAKDTGVTTAAVSSRIYHEPSLAKWRDIKGKRGISPKRPTN